MNCTLLFCHLFLHLEILIHTLQPSINIFRLKTTDFFGSCFLTKVTGICCYYKAGSYAIWGAGIGMYYPANSWTKYTKFHHSTTLTNSLIIVVSNWLLSLWPGGFNIQYTMQSQETIYSEQAQLAHW